MTTIVQFVIALAISVSSCNARAQILHLLVMFESQTAAEFRDSKGMNFDL